MYTVNVVAPNDVIVYDANGRAAVATINGPSTPLVATANPSVLNAVGDISVVNAGGGTPPYNWSVSSPSDGAVSPLTGTSTVYTRGGPNDNTVIVSDSAGNTFTVLISQP